MAIEFTSKLTGHEVVRSCVPGGARLSATRVSGAVVAPAASAAMRAAVSERPTQAPVAAVAAAAARVRAYAHTTNASGADHRISGQQIFGQQKTQLHTMWALRGLDPWSDPA